MVVFEMSTHRLIPPVPGLSLCPWSQASLSPVPGLSLWSQASLSLPAKEEWEAHPVLLQPGWRWAYR